MSNTLEGDFSLCTCTLSMQHGKKDCISIQAAFSVAKNHQCKTIERRDRHTHRQTHREKGRDRERKREGEKKTDTHIHTHEGRETAADWEKMTLELAAIGQIMKMTVVLNPILIHLHSWATFNLCSTKWHYSSAKNWHWDLKTLPYDLIPSYAMNTISLFHFLTNAHTHTQQRLHTWAWAKNSRSLRFILSSTADNKEARRCSSVTVPVGRTVAVLVAEGSGNHEKKKKFSFISPNTLSCWSVNLLCWLLIYLVKVPNAKRLPSPKHCCL